MVKYVLPFYSIFSQNSMIKKHIKSTNMHNLLSLEVLDMLICLYDIFVFKDLFFRIEKKFLEPLISQSRYSSIWEQSIHFRCSCLLGYFAKIQTKTNCTETHGLINFLFHFVWSVTWNVIRNIEYISWYT